MINEALLSQYTELLGTSGVEDMMKVFNDTVDTYLEELNGCATARDEQAFRQQAHRLKGALRSVGMQTLSARMEYCEKEVWTWPEAEKEVVQLAAELPLHQQAIENWLRSR